MKILFPLLLATSFLASSGLSQGLNKVVFGPLEGDSAGVLTVHNGEDIEVEIWVRTDPGNPGPILGIGHALMSEDAIIAVRNGVEIDPYYNPPECQAVQCFVDGPFIHNPNSPYPIPEGYTCEIQVAIYNVFEDTCAHPLDTQGEWEYYGAFLMTCAYDVPAGETYYPFSQGWYPHSHLGTTWEFEGGGVVPDQDFCGLYFEEPINIDPVPNIPHEFSLGQNYPNPFNAKTTMGYTLPEGSEVSIEIFDLLGRKVKTLIFGYEPAGKNSVVWNAGDEPSGIYFYRFEAGDYTETKSCLLLK